MVLLGDEAQVKAVFGPFGDSDNLDARWVHGLRQTYHKAPTSLWTHPMDLLGDVGHVEPCFGLFEDSVSVVAR